MVRKSFHLAGWRVKLISAMLGWLATSADHQQGSIFLFVELTGHCLLELRLTGKVR